MQYQKAIAVVPARGGSKRVPRKNLRLFGGKPLVCYTIDAAVSSRSFHRIILSSDDDEILSLGKKKGIEAERRPDELSGNHVRVLEVFKHILHQPEIYGKYDVVALLWPTCPFRTAKDIKEGFKLLTPDVDSVLSTKKLNSTPELTMTIDEKGFLKPIIVSSKLAKGDWRSQDMQSIFRHTNGGFAISWWKSYLKYPAFYGGKVKAYVMPEEYSVDLDTEADFAYAQFLLDTGNVAVMFNNK